MEDRLRKFSHLIDAGSFTRAARDLHISQPALSMSIQKLERELRTPLYIRDSHPVQPTPAGRKAYETAKQLHVSIRTLQTALADLSKQEIILSMGMIDSIADILLANKQIMKIVESQASVSFTINNSRYLLQAVAQGDIDVAIIADQPRLDDTGYTRETLGSEPLLTACHTQAVPLVMSELAVNKLSSFVSYDMPSHTHALIEQFFAKQVIELTPRFYSSSPDVIFRLLMEGRGAAALPYRKILRQIRQGSVLPLPLPVIERPICVVTRKAYYTPDVVRTLITQLTKDLAILLEQATNDVQ